MDSSLIGERIIIGERIKANLVPKKNFSISVLFPYLRLKAQAETELIRVDETEVGSDFLFCLAIAIFSFSD